MSRFGRTLLEQLDPGDLEELRRLLGLDRPGDPGEVEVVKAGRLLTVAEAAARAHVHVETVRRAVRSGALRASRAGRAVRVEQTDLEAWLRRPRASSRAESNPRPGRRRRARRSVMGDVMRQLDSDAS